MDTLYRKFKENLAKRSKPIKVNGVDNIAFFQEFKDTNADDRKYMFTELNVTKQGDYIDALNSKWLVMSKENNINESYDKLVIQRIEFTIKFNYTGTYRTHPAIIDTKVMDIDTGTYISTAAGKIKVTIQFNSDSKDIALNARFINFGRAWKVTGIDKSQVGIIVLSCDLDATSSYDDLNNDIVDRWRYETAHTYTISIDNGASMLVPLNNLAQMNVTVKDNGVVLSPLPSLTFLTSDSNVVSIDNTGRMTGINLGIATVTVKMLYNTAVTATMNITVVDTLTHQYTLGITGSTTIKVSMSQSYVAHFYDSGIEVFDKTATWTIRNQDGTTSPLYATITSQTSNSCTIKANSSTTYINRYTVVRATLSDDPTKYFDFPVKLVALF